MALSPLTWSEGLRGIATCLIARGEALYHLGLREKVDKSTLADANEQRDWRLREDLAKGLMRKARGLYVGEDLGLELENTVYALDSTTIDLSLSLFPWGYFRSTKAGIKMHTQLDLRGPRSTRAVGRSNSSSVGSRGYLRIKHYFGTSPYAVKTQIWIAVAVYLNGSHPSQAAPTPRQSPQNFPAFERSSF